MENYVSIGEVKIWTTICDQVDSNKPYLCLCGGGPGLGDYLAEVDNLLCGRFNIIRWEQRGCGHSTADGSYTIHTAINDLDEIRRYYNLERWFIGGHSWGAGLALAYALDFPEKCQGIIYVSGIGMQNDHDWSEQFNANAKKLDGPELTLPDGLTTNYDALNVGLRSFNEYVKRPTLYRDISQLRVPTIILYGEDDIRPPWPAIQLSHLLPNCILRIFAGTGHFIWLDKPYEFSEVITTWLDEAVYA